MKLGSETLATHRQLVQSPQNLLAGLLLVAFASFVVWMLSGLSQGTMRSIGPAMLPRWVALAIGACGVALVIIGLLREGDLLQRWHLRGPVCVMAALVLFALTIRSPGFLVAGPLAMLVGGFGSHEVRPKELVMFSVAMTCFCVVLFRLLLNQPLPMPVIPAISINF
jgi:putative tricarboxylic transport membrane protein